MSRIDQLRSEMASALAEAEAQEVYETLTSQYRSNPTPTLAVERKQAAETLQATRASARVDRVPTPEAVSPRAVTAKTRVKGS